MSRLYFVRRVETPQRGRVPFSADSDIPAMRTESSSMTSAEGWRRAVEWEFGERNLSRLAVRRKLRPGMVNEMVDEIEVGLFGLGDISDLPVPAKRRASLLS